MTDIDLCKEGSQKNLDEDTQESKYLTFSLCGEEYGIGISNVIEIIGIQRITHLPGAPDFLKGVINLRGKVIPVMDVRLRFGCDEKEYNERTCIVVINLNNLSVGLIVDTVSEVLDIPAENIETLPKVNNQTGSRYIEGLGKVDDQVKILLNTHKLLFSEETEQIIEALN